MPSLTNMLNRLNRNWNGVRRETAWKLGQNRRFFQEARGSRILVYHGLCENRHLQFNTLFVKRRTFERQLRFYKKYFHLVSLDAFYASLYHRDKFTLCLTFDDGFANNYKYVLPLLEQYQVPATFFITGIRDEGYDILWNDILAIAGKYGPRQIKLATEPFVKNSRGKYRSRATGEFLSDMLRTQTFTAKKEVIRALGAYKTKAHEDFWLQMTVEQIKELSRSKWVTIGSHGYYHNDLSQIGMDLVRDELARSKRFLENITDKEVYALAFPYGAYSPDTVQVAKDIGYNFESDLHPGEILFSPEEAVAIVIKASNKIRELKKTLIA